MLLIASDFIKSVWFVIFPIVDYTHGPIASDSTFCQISGFSLAVGFGSSDVAVLLISLHSALYIIRPRSGLYFYRWTALAVYITFPLLSSSLAFIDGGGKGYENIGFYCYLSNDRGWARLALSWFPRYVSLVVIMLMYIFIYFYVRTRMLLYQRKDSTVFQQKQPSGRTFTTPIIADRRLSALGFQDRPSGDASISGSVPTSREPNNCGLESGPVSPAFEAITWNLPAFGNPVSSLREPILEEEDQDPFSSAGSFINAPPPTHSPPHRNSMAAFPFAVPSTIPSNRSSFGKSTETSEALVTGTIDSKSRRISSLFARASHDEGTVFKFRRISSLFARVSHDEGTVSSFPTWMPGAILTNKPIDRAPVNVTNNRDKIRRQLRSLFVYPLIYLLIWTFPFINHVKGYDSPNASSQPWLLYCSLVSLAIQGAVDSAVFTAREKPWRHSRGVGFWDSVWSVLEEGDHVGRTREELIAEGRIARARRQNEMIDEVGGRETRRNERQWWDIEDMASEAGGDEDERMRNMMRNEDFTMR
jgi:G protein-coupled receptor GPR1